MRNIIKAVVAASTIIVATTAVADTAKNLKHAKKATHYREAVFTLLGTNMGPLGAMAKGKMPLDAKTVEKHATRINQLSLMIADYTRTDTSGFKVKTEALDAIWKKPEAFAKRIDDLTKASAALQTVAMSGDASSIKKAIGGVGKTCGGCHDNFKADD
jgi:cytochrome c556